MGAGRGAGTRWGAGSGRARFLALLLLAGATGQAAAQDRPREVRELRRHAFPEARQGPAVAGESLYAIDTRRIARYDRVTGARLADWVGAEDGPVVHLNAGVVLGDTLWVAHSNYPDPVMLSSVELFDPLTLEHLGSRSLGFLPGSLTWVDRHDGSWWAGLANYEGRGGAPGRPPRTTRVLRLDDEWRVLESFAFPPEVWGRFGTRSNSGGSWGPDGRLYATGHDAPELYVLRLPEAGSVLVLEEIVPVPAEGQAIAWDRDDPGVLLTLLRSRREIVESRMTGLR